MKVSVMSFSYKRGLPEDPAGNGGGFVFDCRAMPNPFWDETLRAYTGCDRPVRDFFARIPEMVEPFLEAAEALARQSIEQYKRDGRAHLQIAFGCTGGQHRSVYFAERLAERLSSLEDVEIEVTHAAMPYWKTGAKPPFVKSFDAEDGVFWSIEVHDPATNRTVYTAISPYALLNSLGEERGDQPLFTCDCGVAECARIYHTRFACTERHVHWSFEELGITYSLFFDRITYEKAAIEMLYDIYKTKEGWKFNAIEYCSYEDFKSAVEQFLAAKPHFKAIWNEIKEVHNESKASR